MCPWVGPHAPSFGRQLWELPSRVELLSPQGVLLPLVYGTTASPLWLELRGRSAGQATALLDCVPAGLSPVASMAPGDVCHGPDAGWPGSDQWPWSTAPATGPVGRLGRPSVSDPWGVGSFLSLGRPTCLRCPGPLGSCSLVCPLGALRCVCGVQGHLAPVQRCARSVRCSVCAVSWATWLLLAGVLAWFVVLRVRCPGPLDSCSPVRPLGVLCCVWCVLGHLAPVHQCVRLVCCFVCAVSWALGSCSPVCPLGALRCVCGVQGHLAPGHRCARSVRCFACAVSWATWLLFTGVLAWFVVLRVRCPGPLGSYSPVRPLGVLCCVWGVPGHLAPVHRCVRLVCSFVCAVSWAIWLLFTGVPGRGVPNLFVVLGACACAVSWPRWRLFTGVRAVCGVLVPLVVVSLFLPP